MNAIIAQSPLFRGLSGKELETALSLYDAKKTEYPRGSVLAAAGGRLARFGLVLSGVVQVSSDDIDGGTVIMAAVTAGGMFGESLCWLCEPEIPVRITAVTDSAVLWLSPDFMRGECLSPLCREQEKRFISILARRTLVMNDRVQVLSRATIREKLALFFKQYGVQGGVTFTVPFDRESLAAWLGVNRSALSRELAKMRAEGLIDFHKNSFRILKQ